MASWIKEKHIYQLRQALCSSEFPGWIMDVLVDFHCILPRGNHPEADGYLFHWTCVGSSTGHITHRRHKSHSCIKCFVYGNWYGMNYVSFHLVSLLKSRAMPWRSTNTLETLYWYDADKFFYRAPYYLTTCLFLRENWASSSSKMSSWLTIPLQL